MGRDLREGVRRRGRAVGQLRLEERAIEGAHGRATTELLALDVGQGVQQRLHQHARKVRFSPERLLGHRGARSSQWKDSGDQAVCTIKPLSLSTFSLVKGKFGSASALRRKNSS